MDLTQAEVQSGRAFRARLANIAEKAYYGSMGVGDNDVKARVDEALHGDTEEGAKRNRAVHGIMDAKKPGKSKSGMSLGGRGGEGPKKMRALLRAGKAMKEDEFIAALEALSKEELEEFLAA